MKYNVKEIPCLVVCDLQGNCIAENGVKDV